MVVRTEFGLRRPSTFSRILCSAIGFCCLALPSAVMVRGGESPLSYERDVRPILKAHCFHCHGEAGEKEGQLDVRLRRLIVAGGESGPALVPGKPEESLLVERLLEGDMPPEEVSIRPTPKEIDTIVRWVRAGAPTARPEPPDLDPDNYLTDEERSFWSFQPIGRPTPPAVRTTGRVRTPIDRFVLARMEPSGLSFAPDAERSVLIRRLYFDLIGLPPSPEDVQAFIRDQRPDAYERLVDRLLASPQYGERWGRHWLDVAGYADSEGYTDADPERPNAHRYRDYVIRAFNGDKPFDDFVIEQLAGDELVAQPFGNLTPDDVDKLVATGFLRMAPDGTGASGVDATVAKNDVIAKTVEVVSGALLGLTVACAQCHDHRYDPIPQRDYYALRAIFEPAFQTDAWLPPARRKISLYTDADRRRAAAIEAEAKKILAERKKLEQQFIQTTFERELAKLPEGVRGEVRKARDTPPNKRSARQKGLLKKYPSVNVTAGSLYLYDRKAADKLKALSKKAQDVRAKKPVEHFVRALWEPAGRTPPKTFLFHRGDPKQPKAPVAPAELTVIRLVHPVSISSNEPSRPTTGRRLAYARWLTSGEHPLVARVLVNRVWLSHFGQGLVPTPSDFGALGVRPTHPDLLDWLARRFMEDGWSLKQLHRRIVTSTTYRQSSQRSARSEQVDAANRLYSHWPLQRLDAETVRDAMLAVSGELCLKAGGPPVPVMADRVGQFVIGKENLNAGRPGPTINLGSEPFRRSIYIQYRRSRPLSVMAPFDLPRMEPNCPQRARSTVSTQSLLLMNSTFAIDRAKAMARRIETAAGGDSGRAVQLAWELAFARSPSADELQEGREFVERQVAFFTKTLAADKKSTKNSKKKTPTAKAARLEAFASLCHALLSSNGFLYVE